MELVVEIGQTPADAGEPAAAESQSAPGAVPAGAAEAAIPADAAKWILAPGEIPAASDDALVRASVASQREAFSELVRRYTNLVYWYFSSRISDPLEVEESTQETMVRAYVNLPRLRVPGAFSSWLVAVAGNVLSEKRRADSRFIVMDTTAADAGPAGGPSPAAELSQEEMNARLHQEMQNLPPHHRTVLAMKHMSGYSTAQIAAYLRVPEGTVRSRLSRAYDALRRKMEPFMLGRPGSPGDAAGGETD